MNVTQKNIFKIFAGVFLLFLCIYYWEAAAALISKLLSAAVPIILGLAIAYVLNILMSFYERHYFVKGASPAAKKTRTPVCLIAAIVTLCGIVALVIWLVIPELVDCVKFLISEVPPAAEKLVKSEFVSKYLSEDILSYLSEINWKDTLTKILDVLISGLGSAAGAVFTVVSSLISGIATALIAVIFAVYLLMGRDRLQSQSRRLLHNYLPKYEERITYVLSVFNDSFHKYIVGQCTEAVILGVLCIVGMLIFRFPYAGMIGTLIGFTALIPIAGAYIGAIVGAVMILTISPMKAVLFVVFIIVLQQLEGNIIYPRVVGKSIGLPAMWVLAAVTIGGGILGIGGMLLGVPAASALYRLLKEDMKKREAAQAPSQAILDTDDE